MCQARTPHTTSGSSILGLSSWERYPEHPQSLEEHLSAIARRTHLERLEAHLLGGGTALSFMGALAEKGSKKAPYWSGYYIKDLDLYSMLGHLPAMRESVVSLIAALIPDDILGFHFPLLGVTPTRPILYLAGYMGGVGFHVEDDGLQFLNLCLPIPSIGASELPNMVEWYMEETDDTGQRIQRAASGAPKDEATKLHSYNHSKSSLEQGLAQQQPTIKQAPVCSNSWEPLGSGSCADLVVGNLGHVVIAAGGWDRISINWATPSHLLAKVFALRGYKPALVEDRRQAFFQSQQGKWECKQGSPLLLTNCTFAALSAPPGRLRLSPSEMESFVALVLLLLMQARKERQQLAWLLHASSSKKRGPASTPTHTPAAGAAAAGTSAAATAAASPGVPKVAVMQADAPHLTVTAAILGTAQAGASGLNDQQQNACERDLLANPRWADAHQCIAHRKDGVLCDIAAGCVGCSLQWLLIRETQQGQQQERLHGQEAELREGEVRQHEGVHTAEETGRLGQPGQQQDVTEAQGEEIIAERNPRRCRQQEQDQDLDKQGQEQGVEIGQDKLEQGEEERSAPWASSGPQFLAWKRGQRRTHQQALAQPAKKARKQQHGQSLPLRQGAPSHSTQRLSWLQRLLCLPPKAQDPTAQALNSNTYWQAWPDHQCEICGSDLELQRAVLVPPTHPLAALVTPSHTTAEKQTKQPAKRGGKKVHKMRLQEQQQQPSSSQAVPSEQVLATWNEAEEENLDSEHRVRHICLGCLVDRRHDGCRHKWLEPKESAVVLLVRQHSLCFLEERLQVRQGYLMFSYGAALNPVSAAMLPGLRLQRNAVVSEKKASVA
ncbi:hypothetical protein DUNSADRAFT_977 [Dunaliella salina]|uniref:Uncharacterized protein n=1 Tax=Dunaliella salina TaxID=3046 RepID=A0ABQ7FY79_DUNSA|nr:hypothetical protein DUNSADRAFT_977 [Dunaliella salina]|eukprot:KAF5827305.1 hypothetical protein DUNSADRAFT_977 [Dunaliella salina]